MAITDSPTIALIGGGYTLQRVAKRLPKSSFVITSRRESQVTEWRHMGWLASRVSLDERETIERLFTEYPSLSVVVDSVPPFRGDSSTQGVENIVQVVAGRNVSKILYLSTTGVFGRRDGSEVTEESPPAPWNSQGEARLRCEQVYALFAQNEPRVAFTALRLPAIYGPDRGIVHSIRSGSYRIVDDGSLWTNRIHVEDLAEIIVRAIHTSELPSVLCVSDDEPTRARDVAEFVVAREGLPYPSSISSEEAAQLGAYTMLSNQRVRNDIMKRLLGISLRYPSYREGLYAVEDVTG